MSEPSIPDMAAQVAAQIVRTREQIGELRRLDRDSNWTTLQMAADEAAGAAKDALRIAYQLLCRWEAIAKQLAEMDAKNGDE